MYEPCSVSVTGGQTTDKTEGNRKERRLRRKKRSVNGCDCKNFILDLRFRVSVVPPSHFTYHLIIICNLLSYLWELS